MSAPIISVRSSVPVERTVQGRVHATHVHKQTDHSHADRTVRVLYKLLLQYLTTLAALRHRINVCLCKCTPRSSIAVLGEALGLVVEDQFQEVILYIFAPERNAVLFLKVPYLVPRVH